MGNDVSCINSASPLLAHLVQLPSTAAAPYIARSHNRPRRRPLITIVRPLDGRVFRFKEPLNVGELMLQAPGHFIAEFGREQDGHMVRTRTRSISALLADANLRALHVYYVLPMDRLNTRLATHELRRIVMAARSAPPPYPAPSYPAQYHAQTSTKMITPLIPPLRQREEADATGNIVKRHHHATQRRQIGSYHAQAYGSELPVPAKHDPYARTHAYGSEPVSAKDEPHRERSEKVRENGGRDDDYNIKQAKQVLHSQRSMSKARTWAPKLDTIMELTL